MDIQRGRSPSQGANIRHSHSPSPHPPFASNIAPGHLSPPPDQPFTTSSSAATAPQPYDLSHHQQQQQQQQFLSSAQGQGFPQQTSIAEHTFLQAGAPDRSASPSFANQQGNLFALGGAGDNSGFDTSTIDPSFLNAPGNNDGTFLDPQLIDPSFGDSPLLNDMAATQAHSPTPPHLLQPDMHRAHSPSPHHSPNMNQGAFTSPGHSPHSRNASLDPSSAAFPQGQSSEWAGMSFRGHRRAPSDAYSDVSSSAHPSPYLGNTEDFDPNGNPSPLLGAQQDPALYSDVMNFGQFSLNEATGSRHVSPAHSPHISPRLMPQQHALPPFTAENNFGLQAPMNNQFANPGLGVYGQHQEAFPPLQHHSAADFGQADHMSPPEINIDFAPPSRQPSFEPPKPGDADNALSPPDRSRSRNRMRAKSDSSLATPSRASTPATGEFDPNSLSPNAAKSRSPSPSAKSSRRSSTSSIPHRDYILDLADPSRPGSSNSAGSGDANNGSKRTQKHPATFQCTLCPKRFTRAYNLRSHLRTHTDERPFVCTVCGKAFARQHDRKRHEGLHSGEKKFVCRGILKDGNSWGCGRRFARADALGRHFRSEAGRVCIRPLLEEEAQEKGWEAQQQAMNNGNGMLPPHMQAPMPGIPMHHPQQGFEAYPSVAGDGMPPPGAMAGPPGGYGLPAALLQQYPALAGIQWDSLPPGPPPDEMEGDLSGRSSFDASSGGEYYEDDENDFSHQGPPQQQQFGYV